MFLQSLRLALRHLRRQRLYSLVIVLSLALGLSLANILVAFIVHEQQTDRFHGKQDRIFRLLSDDPFKEGGQLSFILETATRHLFDRYPEVETICRMGELDSKGVSLLRDQEVFHEQLILAVDSTFFRLFDFPLYEGGVYGALRPGQIVLSRNTALRLFGEEPAVGRVVRLHRDSVQHPLTVAAVIDAPPGNSQFRFDGLVPYADFPGRWGGAINYALLAAGADADALAAKVTADTTMPSLTGPGAGRYSLQSLHAAYFDDSQRRPFLQTRSSLFIRIAGGVVFLILFIAGFNFLHLVVVSQLNRQKEFGVKKVFGADRSHLRLTALAEVCAIMAIAFLVSLCLTNLLLPPFNRAFQTDLALQSLVKSEVLAGFAGLILLLGMVFVAYLSGWLSRLQPVLLLTQRDRPRVSFNRWLFTFQFVISSGLILCTIVMIRQVQFIREKPLGFNRNLVELTAPYEGAEPKMGLLKERLLSAPDFETVARASGNPISGNWIARYQLPDGQSYNVYLFSGDEQWLNALNLELIAGTGFPTGQNGRIVNEQMVKKFGWKEPLGQLIPGTEYRVTGVVRDFNIGSLYEAIPPVTIGFNPQAANILVAYGDSKLTEVLPRLQKAWQSVFPEFSLRYKILSEELQLKHQKDQTLFHIITAFAVASVLITCFGLFALAWGAAQSRAREIGIRKVMGASAGRIFRLLAADYLKWIGLALLLAALPAWYLMQRWLDQFAFRIAIDGWTFLAAGAAVGLIALLSFGFQTIRAALANPVDELRSE